jgi:hypothetical protein
VRGQEQTSLALFLQDFDFGSCLLLARLDLFCVEQSRPAAVSQDVTKIIFLLDSFFTGPLLNLFFLLVDLLAPICPSSSPNSVPRANSFSIAMWSWPS